MFGVESLCMIYIILSYIYILTLLNSINLIQFVAVVCCFDGKAGLINNNR